MEVVDGNNGMVMLQKGWGRRADAITTFGWSVDGLLLALFNKTSCGGIGSVTELSRRESPDGRGSDGGNMCGSGYKWRG